MKMTKIFNPLAYVNKLMYLDGRRRYDKYFQKIWEESARSVKVDFKYRPLISIIVPTYNTPQKFFDEMVESVLAQNYPNWQLVIVDDASPLGSVRENIAKYAAADSRIRYKFLRKNHHIAGATNVGFKIAEGEFVALLDHDDILWPNALHDIVEVLNDQPSLDLIYTDEDKMSYDSKRHHDPFLKPDWNCDLLLSMNYITHFTTIRKSLIDKIGGENSAYNGAQDWDLFLRATETTTANKIFHIPKVLYSWRVHEQSTAKSFSAKSYVTDSQKGLLEAALSRRGYQKADYELFENSGIWTVRLRSVTPRHGQVDLNRIKGLALNSQEIYRNIGRRSLTTYNYHHAQYDLDGELFVPEKIYRKYW
jgi:glycosyltransferase involved in cell wall biosynthesis